jgi:hypothetical protein
MARIVLEIPKQARKGLALLIKSDDREVGAFFDALENAKPHLKMQEFVAQVAEESGQPYESVREMIGAIEGLYLFMERDEATVESVADAAASAVIATGDPSLKMEEPVLARFRNRLRQALSYPETVGVMAKALDVVSEQGRTYCNARVLTDIRPVFPVHCEDAPSAYAIVHSLKIRFHEANDHADFFVVLDAEDVQELIGMLERAQRKENTLRNLLNRQGLSVLEDADD